MGKVEVLRQGLYLRVICRCQVPQDQVLRLYAQTQGQRENLGVVVPEGAGSVLDKKIPAKHLGDGEIHFFLASDRGLAEGEFIPICPEEPFMYISRLKTSFLESEHGKIGIRIQNHPETA